LEGGYTLAQPSRIRACRALVAEDEEIMNCSECRDLYRVFERKNARYLEARSAAFFQVSAKIAIRKHVDVQRAMSDLQEHQAECPWAIAAEQVCNGLTH
jgi:hypothetical protein